MNFRVLVLPVLSVALSACVNFGAKKEESTATAPAGRTTVVPAAAPTVKYPTSSAVYVCENAQPLRVTRVKDAAQPSLKLGWRGRDYTMIRETGQGSGLPRFADNVNGLVWVDLPWKGVLLDSRTEKPIVSECAPATGPQLVQAEKVLGQQEAAVRQALEKQQMTFAKAKSKSSKVARKPVKVAKTTSAKKKK